MKITTVRLRPARSEKLREVSVGRRDGATCAEVTVFGETVAVVSYNRAVIVEWTMDGFDDEVVRKYALAAKHMIEAAQQAGVMPA